MPTILINGEEFPALSRQGVVFRSGDYGEKGAYTDADLANMTGNEPLPVNLEHRHSLLSGKLGQLTRRWFGKDENGKSALFGEWLEPEPLAQLLGETERKVSIELDKATKQPVGLALTWNPHIKDAALFTEAVEKAYVQFSNGETITPVDVATFAYESNTERDKIDTADFADPDNKLFPVRTQEELRDAMKQVWSASDPIKVMKNITLIAERKGLSTEANFYPIYPRQGMAKGIEEKPNPATYDPYYYSNESNTNMRFFIQNKPGDHVIATAQQVATFVGGVVGPQTQGVFVEENNRFRSATPEEIVGFTAGLVKFSTPASSVTPEIQAQLDELAQFKAKEATAQNAVFTATAEGVYEQLLKDNKAVPADKETIVAAFTIAARYDAQKADLAYFSADSEQAKFSLSDHLKKLHEGVKPHNLAREQGASFSEETFAMFDQSKTTFTGKDGEQKTLAEQYLEGVRATS